MENEIDYKINNIKKIKEKIKDYKKTLISILFILVIILLFSIYLNFQRHQKNINVSEQFIKAGILLSKKETEKSKDIYKKIISQKNKFYSPLALNNIIEKDLEKNEKIVLNLFEEIEKIKLEKKQRNLIKLKKGLYLIKISKVNEGQKLLQEIIDANSIWKDTALQILK